MLVRPEKSPTTSPTTSPTSLEPDYERKWDHHDIPQQLHVSKLPSGSLSLGPGQVAIVPVTFLPRYPSFVEKEEDRDIKDINNNKNNSNKQNDNHNKKHNNNNMDDYYTTTVTDGRSPPPLSSTAKLDLIDLVGERVLKVIDNKRQYMRNTLDPTYRRRNNINPSSLPNGDEEYEVSTTVVVDTSRGIVELPISASSIRDNSYGIPDVIKFHHPSLTKDDGNGDDDDNNSDDDDIDDDDYNATCDSGGCETSIGGAGTRNRAGSIPSMDGVVILDTIHATDLIGLRNEKNDRASVLDTIKPERECFDLYLSNPFHERELQIMEVLISRPEFVSVQFDPVRMAALDLSELVGSGPSQVLRQWTEDGPLYLPPDSDNHYILTLCTAFEGEINRDEGSETYLDEMSKWIDSGDPDRNLGFLQIRTDAETLFIGLEHAEIVPFLSLKNESYHDDELQSIPQNISSVTGSTNAKTGTSTLLKSDPERLDFDMISTTSPAMYTSFGLQNKSPVPIRIMRVTIGLDTNGDEEKVREAELIGLKLNISVRSDGGVENDDDDDDDDDDNDNKDQLDSLVLGSATTLDNIFVLKCSLNPDRYFSDSNKEAFHFSGTIVVRGTMDTELSYNLWREETLRNPYRDEHLTLELPFSVSILNGRVEALIERSSHPYPQLFAAQSWDGSGRAVSHLFFPMNHYAAVSGTEDELPQQMYLGTNEIRHDLRILSNMVFPLTLLGAEILDVDDPDNTESLCNRFNVSVAPPSDPDDLYFGFEEIGFLLMKYRFGVKGKRGEKGNDSLPLDLDPHLPKRCALNVITSPAEAGTFRIPLLIFPGSLEVSPVDSSPIQHSSQSNALVGFHHLLSWCRSSRLGKSFIEILEKSSDERRKPKSDSYLLSKYISQNSQWDPKLKPRFHPILLKVGAVDSGKVAKMHVYLTNHNPIPLTISIDVGEVEGMSITLSRDASQETGDGNSLLDYLPKQEKSSLVKLGKYKDHPVAGLLEFLTSNEEALEFTSKFNFRDSLSPYHPAIDRSDVLQLLHDWHSKAFFHRELVSNRVNSNESTSCEGDFHPPVYSSFNSTLDLTKTEGLSGAFILSSDKRLARPLIECWKRDPALMSSDRNTIKIPPGARARFEVQVRAPSQEFLEDDISHLLTSGLVLSTNLGDVMPIFAVSEALQGQLHASQDIDGQFVPARPKDVKRNIMNVPLDLTWNSRDDVKKPSYVDAITIPPANFTTRVPSQETISYNLGRGNLSHGVPLYLRSSFSRDVRLLNVESCNPWFRFVPLDRNESFGSSYHDEGIIVGSIRTNVDCSSNHVTDSGFPSFYQCMLNWLSHRLKLQPEGCGLNKDSNLKLRQIDSVKRTIEVGLRRLKKSYKMHASSNPISVDFGVSPSNESDISNIKTGRRKNDGVIADLDSYDAIWKALKMADNFGYNLLSSSLRATVEYDSETLSEELDDSRNSTVKQNLSLSIHDLTVQSVLQAPKLFDADSDYLEFRPTVVGSITSAVISVRNPTGVPVRVRLGTAPLKESNVNSLTESPAFNSHSYTEIEKIHRIANLHNPYVQNGKSSVPTNDSMSFLWWDGNGGFFIPNEHGDVIRSHHNISVIRGGGSTSVSMLNPSLQSQVGFLVGCGTRCGLRDKNYLNIPIDHPVSKSPIGASAASGITLTGHMRYDSPETNDKIGAEPLILAGGTPIPDTGGPSAFAIPFPALDEIVIPPFGKGQLGPIYFRPPGRYKTIGCDVARKSGTKLYGDKEILCSSQTFDSMIYLENSLTGIEKVGLRGKSVWDHLYFVDPPPKQGEDAFGDIEFRDGMPTLLFSGTSNSGIKFKSKSSLFGKKIQRVSVTKEVVLHNGGDADSEVAGVYFLGMNSDREEHGSCSFGSFKLLNCWDISSSKKFENIRNGFVLKPGESRSFFVEHLPDCTMKKEFVTLRVQLNRASSLDDTTSILHGGRHSRSRGIHNPFLIKDTSMFFGYQMNDVAFARCMPADARLNSAVLYKDLTTINTARFSNRIKMKAFGGDQKESPLLLFQVVLFSTAALLLCYALRARFHAILGMLQKMQGVPPKNFRSNWNAAFRCLARSDPTSTELQTMSREQMRHVVIGRYKAKGNTTSSSLNSVNGFSRDRRATTSNNLRQRTGKEGSTGNDRIRPFSDAIFHDTSVADESSLRIHFPVGLGWRTAYSRGVIKDNSLQTTSFASRTKVLLDRRAAVALQNDASNYIKIEKSENKGGVKTNCTEEKDKNKLNGNKNEIAETASVISTSESEETDANKPESYQRVTNKYNEASQARDIVPSAEKTEIVPAIPKEAPRKPKSKTEKHNTRKGESPIQSIESTNTADLSKRNQKSKNQAPKANERQDTSKLDKFSKNAPWGNKEKEKVAPKDLSDLLGPSPKSTSSKPWQGDRQKTDTDVPEKKQVGIPEKKSKGKAKGKSNKKAEKQTIPGKKVNLDSAQKGMISTMSADAPVFVNRSQPILNPPPGFGGAQISIPSSPTANTHLPPASSTESQPSLETMLNSALTGGSIDTDISLGVTLPFAKNKTGGGSDLFFPGNIRDSRLSESSANIIPGIENDFVFKANPSPTATLGFRVADVAAMAENINALAPPVEQPWLPGLLNEEPEPVEQPWLPDLLNEEPESGFDVMDFLDGILQDGSTTQDEPVKELEPALLEPALPGTPSRAVGGAPGNAIAPVLSNPWASESKSRASAYGISFDDNDENNVNVSSQSRLNGLLEGTSMNEGLSGGLGGNNPLLTPAAILNAEESNKIVVDGDEKAISFYAGLLNE